MTRYSIATVLNVLRYLFSCVGWDFSLARGVDGAYTLTDNRGHMWRVTCRAMEQ